MRVGDWQVPSRERSRPSVAVLPLPPANRRLRSLSAHVALPPYREVAGGDAGQICFSRSVFPGNGQHRAAGVLPRPALHVLLPYVRPRQNLQRSFSSCLSVSGSPRPRTQRPRRVPPSRTARSYVASPYSMPPPDSDSDAEMHTLPTRPAAVRAAYSMIQYPLALPPSVSSSSPAAPALHRPLNPRRIRLHTSQASHLLILPSPGRPMPLPAHQLLPTHPRRAPIRILQSIRPPETPPVRTLRAQPLPRHLR